MLEFLLYAFTLIVCVGLPGMYYKRRAQSRVTASLNLQTSKDLGLTEPPSLHPVIDPVKCIGCGTCIPACPEGEILGLVNGKSELVEPSRCIGHGACKTACPVDAIELVFGTATRGVDIPNVKPDFESNVEGLYIAGELGGMGLIRNAITQGRQAMENVVSSLSHTESSDLDVFIAGAGPAGLAAALQATKSGLRYVIVDQAPDLGGTILSFPRQKLVMTQPMDIPMYGKYKHREISKEELMDLFQTIVRDAQLNIQFNEKVESINGRSGEFEIQTNSSTYRAARVILAIGRRGVPRKLGVPGEDLSKVTYSLLDPDEFAQKNLLVVGGGDSAVEAAVSLGHVLGTTVTIAYRGKAFSRIKQKNRTKLAESEQFGQVKVQLESVVQSIEENRVTLKTASGDLQLENDFVFVFAGGVPPTKFLNTAGVKVETKFGAT